MTPLIRVCQKCETEIPADAREGGIQAVQSSALFRLMRLIEDCDRNWLTPSRLLFLAEFLEMRIIPERVEHRIEPE